MILYVFLYNNNNNNNKKCVKENFSLFLFNLKNVYLYNNN